jgi:hypothetical protein
MGVYIYIERERGEHYLEKNVDIKMSIYNRSMKNYRYENEYIEN